jgi:protein-disulfide isomerase
VSSDRRERAARAEQMRKEREKADRKQRNLITVAIVAVVVVLIAVGGYAIKNGGPDDKPVVAPAGVTKDYGVDYTAADAGGTAGTKPVTVAIYEDFQCPFCKAFEAANSDFLDSAVKSGTIAIAYHPIAILDSGATDNYASRAAGAAMCVLDKGGVAAYKKMHDLLYANQSPESGPGLDAKTLTGLANQAGVSGLGTCISSQKFVPWVAVATDHGAVHATPTIRINGKDVNGAGGANTVPETADLKKAIAAAS